MTLPIGPLFCVIDGPTRGPAWSASAARVELRHLAPQAGARRRFALLHEGIPLPLIQRQLGHSHLSTTGTYLEGINTEEIISTVHARRAPMMHGSAGQPSCRYPRERSRAPAPRPCSQAKRQSHPSDASGPKQRSGCGRLTGSWRGLA